MIMVFCFSMVLSGACGTNSNLVKQEGEARVLKKSKIVKETVKGRKLSIYLPPGYSKDREYKVIYFHDGQFLFTEEWELQPLLDKLIKAKKIDPILLVGIHSTADRSSDLVPYQDNWIVRNWGKYTPRASSFSTFIKEES